MILRKKTAGHFLILFLSIAIILGAERVGNATSITTGTSNNNGSGYVGNMFDVIVKDNALKVTGLDVNILHFRDWATATVELWTREGSFQEVMSDGHHAYESQDYWTLVGSVSGIHGSADANHFTYIDFPDFTLPASMVSGLYVWVQGDYMQTRYTSYGNTSPTDIGDVAATNSDLDLLVGVTRTPRFNVSGLGLAVKWSGTIYYDSTPVPEPATILLVGGGLIGLAGFRGKKGSPTKGRV